MNKHRALESPRVKDKYYMFFLMSRVFSLKVNKTRKHTMGNLLYKPMESHDTSIQEENPEPSPSRLGHGRLDATPTPSVCVNNKVLLAGSDFDPRSPSSQIVRTPILIVHDSVKGADGKGKKSNSLSVRDNNLLNDPRSPSYGDYKRTPIHANTKKDIKMTEPADAEDPNESCSSIMSDSSILLQHGNF